MAMDKWKLTFRLDQCEFIIAAMDYLIDRANERVSDLPSEAFNSFAAKCAKERALEIREEIARNIS